MTAVLIKDGKQIVTTLKSVVREPDLHLCNKVESYVINNVDYHLAHQAKVNARMSLRL
jgi:hypothetical protein